MFPKDFKDLIRIFNRNGVEYLLVGGYAFGVHARARATNDLDLFIRSSASNSRAIFKALCEFGAPLHGMTTKDFQDGESGLQFGQEPHRVDILQRISGVDFEEAWKARVAATIEGDTPINVISREHLLQNKRAAKRPKDLLDVKEIEKAAKAPPQQRPTDDRSSTHLRERSSSKRSRGGKSGRAGSRR
jgi:hypothetical protein